MSKARTVTKFASAGTLTAFLGGAIYVTLTDPTKANEPVSANRVVTAAVVMSALVWIAALA